MGRNGFVQARATATDLWVLLLLLLPQVLLISNSRSNRMLRVVTHNYEWERILYVPPVVDIFLLRCISRSIRVEIWDRCLVFLDSPRPSHQTYSIL